MSTEPPKPAIFAETNTDVDTAINHAAYESYSAIVDDDANLDEEAAWLRSQRLSHKSLHWLYRPSVVMVGITLLMFAFAASSAEGTRQIIAFKLACNSISASSNQEYCDPAETQVLVSSLQQAYSIARGFATIVASGKVGPLSDKYGRKVFLAIIVVSSILGNMLRYALTTAYPTLQFGAMVATEFLNNCTGGAIVLLILANCYVSDIAEASQRTYYLGINIASLYVGMSTGPLMGNFIISLCKKAAIKVSAPEAKYGPNLSSADFAPLRFELIIMFLVLLFVVFVLPESRGEQARRMSKSMSSTPSFSSMQMARPSKIQGAWNSINFLKPMRLIFYPKDSVHRSRHRGINRTRIVVILLVIADCIVGTLGGTLGEIYMLYGIFRFDWSAVDIGHLMAIACSSRAIALTVISPLLTHNFFHKFLGFHPNKRRFDTIDYGVVIIAFTSEIVGQLSLSAANMGSLFLASLVLTAIGSLSMPAIHSSIIKFYPESKIGEVFAGMAMAKNIFSILSPIVVLGLYKRSVKWNHPSAIFLIFSGVFVALAALMTTAIVMLNGVETEASDAEETT